MQRVQYLAAGLLDEGSKALLLASGFASFEARPETEGITLRGLECGLRAALAEDGIDYDPTAYAHHAHGHNF